MLNAPDRNNVIIHLDKRVADCRLVEKTAAQAFHRDEAHVRFLAALGQLDVLRCADVAERELQRVEIAGIDRLVCNLQAMVRDADVAHISLLLRLKRGCERAVRIIDIRQRSGIMELKQVDIVGLQALERQLDMSRRGLFILCRGFRRDHDMRTHIMEGLAKLLFGVGVGVRRVIVGDARVIGFAQQLHRVRFGDALDR